MRQYIYLRNPNPTDLGIVIRTFNNDGYNVTVSRNGTVKTRLLIWKNEGEENVNDKEEEGNFNEIKNMPEEMAEGTGEEES